MKFLGVLTLLLAATILIGCGSNEGYDAAETVAVTGTVKIDGKLADNAEVMFFALGDDERTSGLVAITNEQGEFSLPEVLPGQYRVQVDRQVDGAPDPALSDYGENSSLRADVSASNTNFDFEVIRKK